MKKILIAMLCLMLLLFAAAADTPEIHTEIDYVDLVTHPEKHGHEVYELYGTVSKAQPTRLHVSNWDNPWQALIVLADNPGRTIWIVCNCPEDYEEIAKGDKVHFIGTFQTASDISDAKGNIVQIPFFTVGLFEIIE